jgi:flagellar biosynthesis protein FliR
VDELLKRIGININVTFTLIFYSLIWLRVLSMASVIPFLFGKPVPRYVVVGCAMVLSLFVYPAIVPSPAPALPEDRIVLVVLYLKEAFYGLSIGIMASIIFHAFSGVGQMIDNQRGSAIARTLIPELGEQVSTSGVFLFQLGVVLFLCIGGHDAFLKAFFESFQTLPVLEFPVTAGMGLYPLCDLFMRVTGEVLSISLQMSMPVIIAILLADIILAIANRVAPQINVWELGFNVKGVLGILMLFVSLTIVVDQIERYTKKSNADVVQTIEFLQGKGLEIPALPALPPEEGMPKEEGGTPPVKTLP